MKKYKKIGVYLLAICLIFALTACNDSEADEFTSLQSFEYHFIPEEYEEEYSEYEKTITLEADTDYQFKVDATCESGTIEIRNIKLHGIDIEPTGPLSIVLYVTTNAEKDDGSSLVEDLKRLAPFDKKQVLKNNEYTIYEFDLKQQLQEGIRGFFVNKYENIICL